MKRKQDIVVRAGVLVLCCLSGGGPQAAAQERSVPPEVWGPFRLLEGSWEASIDGRLGAGVGKRRYEFIFNGLYLVSRHSSVRLPQEKSPSGDHHRELAIYSYDRERKTIVLREFINDGYVLQYACKVEPRKFVCVTESVESGPGMRARLTVEITDGYRMKEVFELAGPGQELSVFFNIQWRRVPDLAD